MEIGNEENLQILHTPHPIASRPRDFLIYNFHAEGIPLRPCSCAGVDFLYELADLILEILDCILVDLFDLCIEKLLVFLQGHAGGVVQILKILLTLLNLKINILGVLLHRDKRVPSLVKNSHFLV